MKAPGTLREEIISVLDPTRAELFYEIKICPCCDSSEIRTYFKKYGFQHSICDSCNFVFVNPTPILEKLNELYEADMYRNIRKNIEIPRALRGDDYASLSISKKDAMEIIDRVIGTKIIEGRWLDIGGGIGSILALARKSGLQSWGLSLLEYSSVSANFARDHYNIEVFNGIEQIDEKGIKFDVITLIAVLEHISHPKEFLLSVRKLLKDDGILIINVPQYPFSLRRFNKEYTYFLPPYHLSLFNEKNLSDLLKQIDFDVKETWQNGGPSFVFQYFYPFAEKIDSKIPTAVRNELEYIFSPPLTVGEIVIDKVCSILNLVTYPIRLYLMPRTFLNLVSRKGR